MCIENVLLGKHTACAKNIKPSDSRIRYFLVSQRAYAQIRNSAFCAYKFFCKQIKWNGICPSNLFFTEAYDTFAILRVKRLHDKWIVKFCTYITTVSRQFKATNSKPSTLSRQFSFVASH